MYAMPEFERANADWWQGLARAMRRAGIEGVPDRLSGAADPMAHWLSADLLFSQTCGYPLTHALSGKVTVIATPAYDCDGCRGTNYSSLILVRHDDPVREIAGLAGRTAVVNSFDSQSGFSSLRSVVAPSAQAGAFFSEIKSSGGHLASMEAVRSGRADVCAIDAVTHALAARYRPSAIDGLRVLGRGPEAPGLPYITAGRSPGDRLQRLRAALFAALETPDLEAVRAALLITGAKVLPDDAYDRILTLEREARQKLPRMPLS